MSFELIIGKNGGLFQTIHPFADFHVNVTLGVKVGVGQIILSNDFGRKILAVDAHVLIDDHVRDEEEVFQVAGAVAGAEVGIRDDAVEVELGVNETNSGRADILVSVETVATNSHADAVGFGFARPHGADKVGIGNFAASRNLMR